MIATEATVIAFSEAFNAALVAACNAGGCAKPIRSAFAAAYLRGNPKHALAILRENLGRAQQTIAASQHFQALVLGLMADIEAALPPEEPTTETTQP